MKSKHLILFAAALLLVFVGCNRNKPAQFSGKVIGMSESGQMMLMDITHPDDLVPVEVDQAGNFTFDIDAPEPVVRYVLLEDLHTGFRLVALNGMKAEMAITLVDTLVEGEVMKDCKVKYAGDNQDAFDFLQENEYYKDVQNPVIMKYYGKGEPSFQEFRDELRAKTDELEAKLSGMKNHKIKEFFKKDFESKYNTSLGWYLELSSKSDPEFLSWMETLDRNNNEDHAHIYASAYKKFCLPADDNTDLAMFQKLGELFTNKEMASKLADDEIQMILKAAPANIDEIFEAYKAVSPGREIPEEIQTQYEKFSKIKEGAKAVDFEMYDPNGKKVMLSDFTGKAVYLDVWATWCGPCRGEIPYLEKVFEHYKDNPDVVIVSVSIDQNQEAWQKMIARDCPGWPQYIVKDAFNSSLADDYGIDAIPRFMMFDKAGIIVSVDAPRPSNPDILNWIDRKME